MEDKLFDKLHEYVDIFNENFPTHLLNNLSSEEIIDSIDVCIKNGKPLNPDFEKECDY